MLDKLMQHGIGVSKIEVNAILAEYQIAEGENINKGDLVEFIDNKAVKSKLKYINYEPPVELNNEYETVTDVLKLTDEKLMIVYDNNDYGIRVRIINIDSDGTVTYNSPLQVTDLAFKNGKLHKISDTKVLIAYSLPSSTYRLYSMVLTINEDTVSKGSQIDSTETKIYPKKLISITPNKSILIHTDNLNKLYAKIIEVDNSDVIVFKSSMLLSSSNVVNTAIETVKLNENKFLLVTCEVVDSKMFSIMLEVDGDNLIVNEQPLQENIQCRNISGVYIGKNKVIIGYIGATTSQIPHAVMLNIENDIVTYSVPTVLSTTIDINPYVIVLSESDNVYIFNGAEELHTMNFTEGIFNVIETVSSTGYSSYLSKYLYWVINITNYNFLYQAKLYKMNFMKTVNGIAKKNGTEGQEIEFYDWRLI